MLSAAISTIYKQAKVYDIISYSSVASGSAALFDLAAFLRLEEDLLFGVGVDVTGAFALALCL